MPDTQISEEMVERAAAAIRELTGPYLGTPEQIAKHGERIRLRQEESARKFARAALEAALSCYVVVPREPTEAMRIAGAHIHDQRPSEVASIYRAMIQAAPPVASDHVVGWRTMDSAPKDGRPIDVWFDLGNGQAARWADVRWDSRRERWNGGPTDQGLIHWNATHWQPLPTPPEMEG